jgi:hypothetical protein
VNCGILLSNQHVVAATKRRREPVDLDGHVCSFGNAHCEFAYLPPEKNTQLVLLLAIIATVQFSPPATSKLAAVLPPACLTPLLYAVRALAVRDASTARREWTKESIPSRMTDG